MSTPEDTNYTDDVNGTINRLLAELREKDPKLYRIVMKRTEMNAVARQIAYILATSLTICIIILVAALTYAAVDALLHLP